MKTYNYYLFLLGLSFILLFSVNSVQAETTSQPTKKDKASADISKLEKEDLNSFENSSLVEEEEEDEIDEEGQSNKKVVLSFPKWKYYTGATVGSIAGFGLGHAIQGRYMLDDAWKYSIVESALIGGMILAYNAVDDGFNIFKGSSDRSVTTSTKDKVYSSIFGLLGVGLLSCKLFEITALWSDPKFNTSTQNYDIYATDTSYTPTKIASSWNIKLTGISPDLKLTPGVFFSANF